ncbi:peptide/nickel transport system permease protein [Streptoalloteichus tenebrarius]|uniref:Peptide/nickel transport system permease protein n=1 Tax=Streptoalloteichus tenebrarius (strain ATCC 17920 / DSM 40477 / JCM 4838 / CBS 697.72 / NBRC 16177 / NCIMB 11028 / NRRL B-12390 / A12253. 1 / ISP 5477) TaxID=1933 RepID=A0ABT1HW09_STRSD|nr:ABC transporter permease [Streptoalloteichus tenebrarius]MCP2259657.1 peptide/nickel transport system permease protein [Streptoalloteichus tenebrarius]BFF00935.1 ABC transporter permease [Streptoalloteichus tenebrarius]
MAGFLLRRLANYVVLCLVATFLAFTLASLTFDPLAKLNERNPPPPASVIEAKRRDLRLDEPVPQRFVAWMSGVARGDFGNTATDQPITAELGRRVGVSLRLFLIGTLLGVTLGVLVGVVSAVRQYRFGDYFATLFSFLVLSTPVFLIGTLLKFGALRLNQGFGFTVLYFTGEADPSFQGGWAAALLDRLRHLVLPTLAIALHQIAFYSRYQRSAMLDVLGSDFLRTAQAKGLTRRRALFRHGLRTALIPMATLFAFSFGLLITGGVFTERIFGWFGMGDWLVYGVEQQDTNIVATVTLFVAVLVLVSGWLSDVLYAALDPRVRV